MSPTTTKEWIEQTLGESQDEDTVLLTLRQEEFRKIQEQLRAFEGISTVEQGRLLSVSKTLNSPLDAELNKYWESVLDANSGWSIRAESSQGMTTVASEPPRRVQPIATTLDNTLQSAAKQAVDSEQRAAVLVVLNPRTGGVLAVAQNDKANNQSKSHSPGYSHRDRRSKL